jgi:hypothetical protein
MNAAAVLTEIVTTRVSSMVRLVTAIKERGELSSTASEWEVAVVIAGMLLEFKVTPAECERILHPIEHHEWEKTPTLHVHSLLCSQMEWNCLILTNPASVRMAASRNLRLMRLPLEGHKRAVSDLRYLVVFLLDAIR